MHAKGSEKKAEEWMFVGGSLRGVTCLLNSKAFCNIPITVTAHSIVNSSRDVIQSKHLEGVSGDEIYENLSQHNTSVRRICIQWNNDLIPLSTFIFSLSVAPPFHNQLQTDTLILQLNHKFQTCDTVLSVSGLGKACA